MIGAIVQVSSLAYYLVVLYWMLDEVGYDTVAYRRTVAVMVGTSGRTDTN